MKNKEIIKKIMIVLMVILVVSVGYIILKNQNQQILDHCNSINKSIENCGYLLGGV